MEQFETRARARITEYTAAAFVALASLVFFTSVPFIPDSPVLPLLVAIALAVVSLRNRGASVALLYLLVFMATLWQMIGFGFFQLLRAGVGVAVLVALLVPLLLFYSRRVELTSMSIGVLCVSLLFTPAYFVSVPLIAAAATVTGFASLEAISLSFVLFAFPFLLLDNALYFISSSHASTPIAFAQLTYLAQNLRPPVPGLNPFLTALPRNYISPLAPEVSAFLSSHWALLVVPLLLIGLIIMVAASVGGLTLRFLRGLSAAREWSSRIRIWIPIAVSLVVPAAFILLIFPLSLPGAGGFQSGLTVGPSHIQVALTLASAPVLGLAFVGREILVERLEGSELGQTKVLDLVGQARTAMDVARAETAQIQRSMPLVNTSQEERTLAEHSSYVGDVERRVKDAGGETLTEWEKHLGDVVLPSLRDVKARLMSDVFNQLSNLRGVIAAVNEHLNEASVPMRYSPIPETEPGIQLDNLTELYQLSVKRIEEETNRLFTSYGLAFDALNQLLELKGMAIPIAPDRLLESGEYVTAMRLVSEDYWLTLHLRYAEELQEKEASLVERLSQLSPLLGPREATRVEEIMKEVGKCAPADSASLLSKVKELREILLLVTSRLADYPETMKKTIDSINPAASGILTFQTARRREELLALKTELASAGVGLESLTKFLGDAIPVISGQAAALESDREGLSLLAHYPAARRAIRQILAKRRVVKVEQLPYERRTAAAFLRLYAAEVPASAYDESEGVLTAAA